MTKITWIRFQSSGNIDRDSAIEFGGCSRHFHRGGPTIPGIFHLRRILFLLGALLLAWPALADYYDGLREWDAGRYQEAWVKWQEAAGEGDARSMMAIGRLYEKGLGAPQDYIEAHKWFNLAASHGMVEALAERDTLAEKMTPAQIATAQERAASWNPVTSEAETATAETQTYIASASK